MSKFKVLIADNTSSVRQFIRYTLEDHFKDVEFEVATNGKNIQKRVQKTHFDLILYDKDMSLLNGEDMLKWLRGHQALKNTPFIMISGNGEEESIKSAMELGANAYLIKPLLMDPIIEKVKDIFSDFQKDRFDRRKNLRHMAEGEVLLSFNSYLCTGTLLNLSMGGILGLFDKSETLPKILDKVDVDIGLDNKNIIKGVPGQVVRMQAVDTVRGTQQIQVAVMYSDEISAEIKREILNMIASLKS